MGVTAIIGDVAGELDQLRACLATLGVTDTVWPDGLHVVQVGDLFGGTDHDVDVAHLVQPHLYAGRWTQLVGNWELAALGGPRVGRGGMSADLDALQMFARWAGADLTRYATSVASASGTTAIVTHAGITREWMDRNVHGPSDARSVVTRINNMSADELWFGGEMFGHPQAQGKPPSPVWASIAELWRGWSNTASPWPQVHGHTTSRDWRRQRWCDWVPSKLALHATPVPQRRHVKYQPAGAAHPIWGIDPGLWQRSPIGSLIAMQVRTPDV